MSQPEKGLKVPYPKKLKIKYISLLVLLLFVLASAWTACQRKNTVPYYTLQPLDLNQAVLASGRVSQPEPYSLTAVLGGKIAAINCAEGELVQTGQLLIQLDDYLERRNLQIAANNLQLTQSQLTNIQKEELPRQEEKLIQNKLKLDESEKEMQRLKILYESGAIAAVEYDNSVTRYRLALSEYNKEILNKRSLVDGSIFEELKARLSTQKALLELAEKAVDDKKIRSPFTATVSRIHLSEGQQASPGAEILTILKQQDWVVEAEVDQKELPLLKNGLPALIALDAYPLNKLEARLSYISPQVDTQKGTCLLRIEIKEQAPFIKHGMAANVEILAGTNQQVLALPRKFLDFSEREAMVWVWKNGQAQKLPAIYRETGERWVILEGFPAGTVILSPDKNKAGVRPGREVVPDAV